MTLRVARLTAKFTALFTAQVRDARGRGVTSTIIKKRKRSLRGLSFNRLHAVLGEDCLYALQGNALRKKTEIELNPLPKTLRGMVY